MSKINPLISKRRPEYLSYSDNDIQRMYEARDNKRKAVMLEYDKGKVTESQIDELDSELFKLDDELCARGF